MAQENVQQQETNSGPHITIRDVNEDGSHDRGREPHSSIASRSFSRSAGRSRSRGSSRSSRRRLPPVSPLSGLPIEYRTLSIHVSESRNVDSNTPADVKVAAKDDRDYFANLTFHESDPSQVCQQLNVDPNQGLSESTAAMRLERDGENTLPRPKTNYLKKLFFYVFGGFCSVLWVGVIIFFICWKPLSNPPSPTNLALAVLVLIVIAFQACFSAVQDWSTQRTMKSITDLLPSETLVVREGKPIFVPANKLVAGDIVNLKMGNRVPADIRLLNHSGDIRFDRSVLTGESEETEGTVNATDPNILESRNIALMGSVVVNGTGNGVVILTGARSVMGRIAHAMSSVDEKPTLIQREIWRFVRIIVCLTVCLALLIALTWVGWLRRDHPGYLNVVAMLNNVMGTVVAFIPEGMPIAVSLTLMMVARRMKAVDVLPKGLSTVETLGCVNVICSDKTGTLTQNQMRVTSLCSLDEQPSPNEITQTLENQDTTHTTRKLQSAALLCNDASFDPTSLHLGLNERTVQGNATDAALLRFFAHGRTHDQLKGAHPKAFQIPFNSKNKWMLTMYRDIEPEEKTANQYQVYVKGAPDVLFPGCTKYWSSKSDSVQPLDAEARSAFKTFQDQLSNNAERVIVLCEKKMIPASQHGTNEFSDEIAREAVQGLTVIGILGILDPPRPEAKTTIAECRRAGARFFMVTGDYGLTAAAIARSLGIFTGQGRVDHIEDVRDRTMSSSVADDNTFSGLGRSLLLEGSGLSGLVKEDWDMICEYEEIVFARTTPEQKLRIVNEFQERDNVVAVTGDGVNDAPALRAADVGVAVGSGSDVAIEAADLVLLDRFDSILEAIRLGRLVFQNLQKVIAYLLSAGSWSEIWPVILNVFFGVPLPLSSFLMIIICVFTDLFSSLSLIMEKAEFDLLSLPPRNHKRDHLITTRIYGQAYLFTGSMETCTAHAMFFLYMWRYAGIPVRELFLLFEGYSESFHGYSQEQLTAFNNTGQCVYFVTLVFLQWGNLLAVRNRRLSIVQADPFTKQRRNPWLILSMIISLVIAIFVTEVPGLQTLFGTASVPIEFWLIPIPLALGILMMDEIRKLLVRIFPRGPIALVAW